MLKTGKMSFSVERKGSSKTKVMLKKMQVLIKSMSKKMR